jgi:dienelactone hydrolase
VFHETFTSGPDTYKITMYPAPADGREAPTFLLVHGNFGLGAPFGDQIQGFGSSHSSLGYLAAVPQYYTDNVPHLMDM